jgi:hypothetical protein
MTDEPHPHTLPDLGHIYQEMLDELREEHGAEIDYHIRDQIRDVIHESYKELDGE